MSLQGPASNDFPHRSFDSSDPYSPNKERYWTRSEQQDEKTCPLNNQKCLPTKMSSLEQRVHLYEASKIFRFVVTAASIYFISSTPVRYLQMITSIFICIMQCHFKFQCLKTDSEYPFPISFPVQHFCFSVNGIIILEAVVKKENIVIERRHFEVLP